MHGMLFLSPTSIAEALQNAVCRFSGSNQNGVMCLPLNTYSIVQTPKIGALVLGAGTLLKDGSMLVARQMFDRGNCIQMSLGVEKVGL